MGSFLHINRGMPEDVLGWTSHHLLAVFVTKGIEMIADVGSTLFAGQCGPRERP